MRSLRPLFRRSSPTDEFERQAERLRNRDWIEMLRVVHPAQAVQAEQEYLLARFRSDWSQLVNPLLAQHSQPDEIRAGTLRVLCDHNTFANELSLLATAVEQKIFSMYGYRLKIKARATRQLSWPQQAPAQAQAAVAEKKPDQQTETPIDWLIAELTKQHPPDAK